MNLLKATNTTLVLANNLALLAAASAVVLAFWFPWQFAASLAVWQLMSILGIAVGVHRYFSHRAFKAGAFWQWAMAVTSMGALNGPPCMWAEAHAKHHAYADTDRDPYSQFLLGGDSSIKHTTRISQKALTRIMRKSRLHRLALKYHWAYVGLAAATLTALGVAFGLGVIESFLWLWLAPAGMTQASLRLILWTGHTPLGYKTFDTPDNARNWWFTSLFCAGEGWHNNHHHDPRNPNCGVRWWEFDVSYLVIRLIRSRG
jgi:stearoyl-CoA desaturase (delta-9 desaturase)